MRERVARASEGEPARCRIVVLQAAGSPEELGYVDELSACAREHAWFDYVPAISRIWLSPDWPGERGRAEDVARLYLDRFGFTPAGTTAYVCGNPDMIENVAAVLRRAGFPADSVRKEMFWHTKERRT